MKFKGTIIGEASGSLASLTFSHNRGGQYIRQRVVPVDPGTVQQTEVRGYMANLTSRWLNVLTVAQREAWNTYAEAVPLPDSLGEPRNIGGLGMYVRGNVPRLQGGLTYVDDAPLIFNLGDFTQPTITSIVAASDLITLEFDENDAWVGEDDAAMLFLGSRGVNASRNFFKGPYRFAAAILGNSTTPPTSPTAITNPFPLGVGQKAFIQVRVVRADGRTSSPFRGGDVVT